MPKSPLTTLDLKNAAKEFARFFGGSPIPSLYGATDGKAVGTYVEHRFHEYLHERFNHVPGSSASGIDFPEIGTDLKVTSVRQPQSSCPFRDAGQKVYGLAYDLLVFVYEKTDDPLKAVARLDFRSLVFLDRSRTADFQTTRGILEILERDGNRDDLIAFLEERNLPLDEIGRGLLADRIIAEPPRLGYLTMSNALQWRLQYSRVIEFSMAGDKPGVEGLL